MRKYATLEDFGKTFNIVDIKKQIAEKTDNEILEVWEQNLYTCPSVYKAFKFFEKLNLKKTQLIEFADYLGVAIYTYADKSSIIRKLVYATVGEKLKDDPVRKRNIEKYKRNTANCGVIVNVSFEYKKESGVSNERV